MKNLFAALLTVLCTTSFAQGSTPTKEAYVLGRTSDTYIIQDINSGEVLNAKSSGIEMAFDLIGKEVQYIVTENMNNQPEMVGMITSGDDKRKGHVYIILDTKEDE